MEQERAPLSQSFPFACTAKEPSGQKFHLHNSVRLFALMLCHQIHVMSYELWRGHLVFDYFLLTHNDFQQIISITNACVHHT